MGQISNLTRLYAIRVVWATLLIPGHFPVKLTVHPLFTFQKSTISEFLAVFANLREFETEFVNDTYVQNLPPGEGESTLKLSWKSARK